MTTNLAASGPPAVHPPRARRVRAYVGLGSNLGDSRLTLTRAVAALRSLPGVRLAAVSRLYATRPVGLEGQPEFRNAVVALDVARGRDPTDGALAFLIALKGLERAFGRLRRERWGPRELDLDLLLFGRHRLVVERPPDGLSLDTADDLGRRPDGRVLIVPHPEVAERLFVLAPLSDIAPSLVPPGWSEDVTTVRRRRERVEGPAAARPIGSWVPAARSWALQDGSAGDAPRLV